MDVIKQNIIDLCFDLFGETKKEVKKSNKSVDALICIFEELKKQEKYAEELYAGSLYTHSLF